MKTENENTENPEFFGMVAIAILVVLLNLAAFDLGRQIQKVNTPTPKIPTVQFSFHGDTLYLENGRGLDKPMLYDFVLHDNKNGSVTGTGKYDSMKIRIIK